LIAVAMKPRISCIIPVFNDRERLARAVTSVLRQVRETQVVIVDDGSRDGSALIAHDLARADSRVLAMSLGSNMGPAVARNIGVACAEAPWVAFLDSDDEAGEDFYPFALKVLERDSTLAAVRGHIELIRPDGALIRLDRKSAWYDAILASSACTFVVDRHIAAAIGFPVGQKFRSPLGGEDIVFAHTLLTEFRVAQVERVAVRVLVKPGGRTAQSMWGTPVSGMPVLDPETRRLANEAIAQEVSERRKRLATLPAKRDPKQ
jgi:glycosyltransferase involved in cell wall biosynthesis